VDSRPESPVAMHPFYHISFGPLEWGADLVRLCLEGGTEIDVNRLDYIRRTVSDTIKYNINKLGGCLPNFLPALLPVE